MRHLYTLFIYIATASLWQALAQPLCSVARYDEDSGMSQWHVTQMFQDEQGFLWFSTWNGIDRFDGYQFVNFKSHVGDGCDMPNDRIRDMRLYSDGNIYVLTDDRWFLFRKQDAMFSAADEAVATELASTTKWRGATGVKDDSVAYTDRNGYLWTLSDGHLYYALGGERHIYPLDIAISDVQFQMADSQDNLWLITGNGVFRLTFSLRPATPLRDAGMSQGRCFLLDRDSHLWVATKEDRCLRLYDKQQKLLGYITPTGKLSTTPAPFASSVYCLLQTRDGTIWAGTKPDGLFRITPPNTQHPSPTTQHYKVEHFPDLLSNNNVYDIQEDSYGRLWIATLGGGINVVMPNALSGGSGTSPTTHHPSPTTQHPSRVRRLHITRDGILLAATTEGLLVGQIPKGDPSQIQLRTHRRDAYRKSSLSCNATMDIAEDDHHHIYISTESGGVNRIESRNLLDSVLTFRHYDMSTGMSSDIVLALATHGNRLWAVGNNRIMTIDTQSSQSSGSHQLLFGSGYQFSEAHPLLLPDSGWLIGQMNGTILVPDSLSRQMSYTPQIVLTGIDLPGEEIRRPMNRCDTLRLSHDQRSVTLHFAALHYASPEAIAYAFRLSANDEWNYIGSSHMVSLADLNPGTYRLQLRSTTDDGVWADNIRTITIIVAPTFWEAWYGRMLLLLIVLAVAATSIHTYLYIRRLKRQQHETLEKYLALVNQTAERADGATATTTDSCTAGAPDANTSAAPSSQPHPPAVHLKKEDKAFMARVMTFIEAHIADADANIGDMADAAATSRSGLNRKMKQLVGLTPADFLREARIKRACQLLTETGDTVTDIAYSCGFSDPKYFAKCFKQSVGLSPTDYRER